MTSDRSAEQRAIGGGRLREREPMKTSIRDGGFAAALLAATLAPFVAAPIPPMTDLPQHVLVGQILLHFDDPSLGFRNFFAIDAGFRPLVVPHLFLAGLQVLAGPIGGAKLFLALFVVFTYLATWALLASARVSRPVVMATAVLPLCMSGLVYMGFLPFVLSYPLYALLLAVWLRLESSLLRTAAGAALLLMLFICHLVGAVVGAFAIFVLCLAGWWRTRGALSELARDLAALVPVTCAVLWFVVLQDHPSDLHLRFDGPIGAVKALLSYNLSTLSGVATGLNALGLVTLFGAIVASLRRGDSDERLLLASFFLIVVGVVAPISIGILWPAGPRLFPFAYLTALTLLHPRQRGVAAFRLVVAAIVLLDAGLILRRSLEIDRDYARFLSGAPSVAAGSRILPLIDVTFDRSGPILPFWSIGSLYTVERGGEPSLRLRPPALADRRRRSALSRLRALHARVSI